jgi:UV DNA damage endonuclease
MGPEAVLVTHVGGVYGEREEKPCRWIRGYEQSPEPVRRRLVLENDRYPLLASDVLGSTSAAALPQVFDYQHHWCLNPDSSPCAPRSNGSSAPGPRVCGP